jgi:hypothetical protein
VHRGLLFLKQTLDSAKIRKHDAGDIDIGKITKLNVKYKMTAGSAIENFVNSLPGQFVTLLERLPRNRNKYLKN